MFSRHLLRVVEDDIGSHKLAFCNNLGNLFFDYKKYDQEYANVSEKHKLIDPKCIKDAVNVDLSKHCYHTHMPSFIIKGGELEGQSLEDYRADVYEIAKNQKIGTLIDEFCFYERDTLRCVDYHQGYDHNTQELDVRVLTNEGNLQAGDHPVMLNDGFLGY